MSYIITSLCLRDGGCIEVCPVECIVPGDPVEEWPWMYIDPDTCIDCGACVPECPYEAIFPEDEVPSAYSASGGEYISRKGFSGHYEGTSKCLTAGKRPVFACGHHRSAHNLVQHLC